MERRSALFLEALAATWVNSHNEQPVVTAVQLVDFRQPRIFGQRTALKPLAMQVPLAARRQQAVGDQHEKHLSPMRPFAAHSQPLRPELIELQLATTSAPASTRPAYVKYPRKIAKPGDVVRVKVMMSTRNAVGSR
jgi:hypothetical protein